MKSITKKEYIIIDGKDARKLTDDDGYYCKLCNRVHKLSSPMYSIHETTGR